MKDAEEKTELCSDLATRELLAELTSMIAAQLKKSPNVRTDEIRDFIRAHMHLGDFKSLAVTMIMLAEGEKASP